MTGAEPYGSWPTPITADLVLSAAVRVLDLQVDGPDVYWAEGRPAEAGRVQLVRRAGGAVQQDVLPDGFAARTAAHEYGGGAWWVREGVVWFANWSDQRLYRLPTVDASGAAPVGAAPVPLTPEPAVPRGDRYADGDVSPDGSTIAAVRERHPEGGRGAPDVRNELVLLDATTPGEPQVLVTGPDFVAAPRWSPDGSQVAYLRWNHPSMPWDATELVVLELATGTQTFVAGGPGESVLEPRWDDAGRLLFLSDRTDWWNVYAWTPATAEAAGTVVPVLVTDGEVGTPAWQFGQARFAALPGGRIVAAVRRNGTDAVVVLGPDGTLRDVDVPFTEVAAIRARPAGDVVVIAGSPVQELGVHAVDVTTGSLTTICAPRDPGVDAQYLSVPEAVTFPSGPDGERTAHALFYPPANPGYRGPEGASPPLLVVIHGGPTAAASSRLNLGVQFWTTRGFAVVDVDYGGSSGYGRRYRERLRDAWGIVDVEDCIAAAAWLAGQGRVDGRRLCIRGGSAGGFTTLAALARADTPFAAGADYFGVADLEALAAETHKFESRYLDGLIGPYPQSRDVYVARSPLTHVDEFRNPLIVLQGSEDAVVPPKQSELIVDALRAKRVPVAYLLFEGEQHGFRRAENIRRALEAELSFYSQVLGFVLPEAEGIEPVVVENLHP